MADSVENDHLARRRRRRMMAALWLALGLWTIAVSIGTSLHSPSPESGKLPVVDWRRGLAVFLFVGSFLSLWVWLATRPRTRSGFRERLSNSDAAPNGEAESPNSPDGTSDESP